MALCLRLSAWYLIHHLFRILPEHGDPLEKLDGRPNCRQPLAEFTDRQAGFDLRPGRYEREDIPQIR
jgi:hypothetical protein